MKSQNDMRRNLVISQLLSLQLLKFHLTIAESCRQ